MVDMNVSTLPLNRITNFASVGIARAIIVKPFMLLLSGATDLMIASEILADGTLSLIVACINARLPALLC